MSALFIGIMSGTSLDGADAVLADFSGTLPRSLGSTHAPFPPALKDRLLVLTGPGSNELDEAGACCVDLAEIYAQVAGKLLHDCDVPRSAVAAIGCHGQTVRHHPELRYSIQLNEPALLAERMGIDVVADFRRRDIAAGGQGAPLVPVFHDAVFRHVTRYRAVVNIGGIANVSSLRPGCEVTGFDCGPGNVLMDAWIRRHRQADFDDNGRWASEGNVDPELLGRLANTPFLGTPPPRSTGRELFNESWLQARLGSRYRPEDVQATLLEFTATTIVDAIDRHCGRPDEIYLCGGGARNGRLASRIGALASPCPVRPTDELGVPAEQVEAMAFAWLAMKCVRREALDLRSVTGASHPAILGAVYPA